MDLIPTPIKKEPTSPLPMPPKPEEPGKLSYDNGIIMLTTKFDNKEIMPIVAKIIEYNLMEIPLEKITLYINSPGGEVSACMHLIDIMKQSRIPVNTYAMGLAASCAFMTLMAGKKRYATKNTMLMSHVYSTAFEGKESDLPAFETRTAFTSDILMEHYKKCTGKTEKYIRKHLLTSHDVWLTASDCVKHNIIDEVIQTY
jgi:ATP-dependent Clp protease protease subunit